MPKVNKSCPGLDPAYLKDFSTNIIPCPKCGHEIEFFSGERRVKCPKCYTSVFNLNPDAVDYKDGKLKFKSGSKTCLDWCGGCLNKSDYDEIKENSERLAQKRKDLQDLIDTVPKEDKQVIDFFIEAFKKSINHPKLFNDKIFDAIGKKDPDLFRKARNYYLDFLSNK